MSDSFQKPTLTDEQLDYLLKHFAVPSGLAMSIRSSRTTAHLSAEDRRDLLDQIGDRLQKRGFDKRHEPNAEGQMLESLIDIVR